MDITLIIVGIVFIAMGLILGLKHLINFHLKHMANFEKAAKGLGLERDEAIGLVLFTKKFRIALVFDFVGGVLLINGIIMFFINT